MSGKGYGVIAYVPTPSKKEDEAHFDGWYTDLADAELVFEDFRASYPEASVHMVTRVKSATGRGGLRIMTRVASYPEALVHIVTRVKGDWKGWAENDD